MRDLQLSIGMIALWLITVIVNRKRQSLHNFLVAAGWRKNGWCTYEKQSGNGATQ